MRLPKSALVALAAGAISSCGGGESFDRNAMLVSLGDVVIVPSYAKLASASAALRTATTALCANPTLITLQGAQDAWADAHAALDRTSAFDFGPYMALPDPAEPALDFWPARTNLADTLLASADPITLGTISNAQKGFPIAEYLLFGSSDDATVLAAFTEGTGARRCTYLGVVVEDIATRTAGLEAAWSGPTGYAHELATAGAGSEIYPLTRIALADVLERVVFSLEDMRDMKLGVPLGLTTDNLGHAELVESPYAHGSLDAMRADLESIESVYTGDLDGASGIGLSEWMLTRNPALDATIRAQIDTVRAAILAIDVPLDQAVVSERDVALALHEEIRTLHRYFGVDVAGVLAVTISFNDTDGD